jgi:hypothetical protein
MAALLDVVKSTTREILHDQHREWRKVLVGLDANALNWKPGPETNSIAVLVAHTFDAERFLMATVLGVKFERDREATFRTVAAAADELLRIIDQTETEVDVYVERLSVDSLLSDLVLASGPHSGAWCPLHAIEHSREHLGQALLTRQMYEQQRR